MTVLNCLVILIAIYLGAVYFYLRALTRKYLTIVDRSYCLSSSLQLKTAKQLRDKFANKDEINVLVLTGGGVRGLIPLQVLSEIERLTGKKSGELFDFMAGTSTGAINCGIMAVPNAEGGTAFSALDICRDYVTNIRQMFKASWYHSFLTLWGLFGPRYLPEGKLKVLQGYLGEYTLADLNSHLIIPVYDLAENSLHIIRSWEPRRDNEYDNYLLCDLIHGASNPPMLFSPRGFMVKNRKRIFIDPGVIINNPAEVALLNMWFLFPNKKIRLVLIGNGGEDSDHYRHDHMAEFGAYGLVQYLVNSPIVSTKFSTAMVMEYMQEARDYGLDVEVNFIKADGGYGLATSDTSDLNLQKINAFASKMINENQEQIINLAAKLKNSQL